MLLTQFSPSPIFLAATSIMPIPQTFTANASGLRRLPLQSGHGLAAMYLSISCLVWSDSVFLYRRFKLAITPSYLVSQLYCRPRRVRCLIVTG